MSSKISVLADAMMETLLAIMSGQHGKSSTVMEDAFLTVGAITTAVDGEFLRYMERFLPILLGALNNFEEHTVNYFPKTISGCINYIFLVVFNRCRDCWGYLSSFE